MTFEALLRIVWKRSFVLLTVASIALALAGCSSSEQFGSVVATTDLKPGASVSIQTETTQVAFTSVETAIVAAGGTVTFARLLPGEYRLVTQDGSGAVTHATAAFGVGVGRTTVTFLTATAPAG